MLQLKKKNIDYRSPSLLAKIAKLELKKKEEEVSGELSIGEEGMLHIYTYANGRPINLEKDIINRAEICLKEGLCFISLKKLSKEDKKYIWHSDCETEIPVHKKYIGFTVMGKYHEAEFAS